MADEEYVFKSKFNDRYNLVSRKIVRMISEDSRISISNMSAALSFSRRSVKEKLNKLESELGIRYTIELNENIFGSASRPHLIAVKFATKPDWDEIKRLLEQSYIPQVAVTAKGKYDLLIYAIATSSGSYAHWDKAMQILLADYGADWYSSEVIHRQLGFFPIRNEFIDKLEIEPKYREMLKLLNTNSRMSFSEMSQKLGIHFNTVAYNFNKLLKKNYINRFTITMDKPKDTVLMSFFAKHTPRAGYEESNAAFRKVLMTDDDNSLISRYLISSPLIGGYDYFTLGIFDDYKTAYSKDIKLQYEMIKKHSPRVTYALLEKTLLGRLPIRSLDTKKEYKVLKWVVNRAEPFNFQ